MTPELVLPISSQTERNHKDDLKLFSYLGGLQSKVNFLHTCTTNKIVPTGFKIKWQEQTGFDSPELADTVSNILTSASLSLMKAVQDVSLVKFEEISNQIVAKEAEVPNHVWQKGIQNYNFCFNQASQRLAKKVRKISGIRHLNVLLPHKNLSTISEEFEAVNMPQLLNQSEQIRDVVRAEEVQDLPNQKIFFTPDMIVPIPYNSENFMPSFSDGVIISDELSKLCSLSPSFSPTPPSTAPPVGVNLHEELLFFKKRLSWNYHLRKKELQECGDVDEFIHKEAEEFIKNPWYVPSTREPPPLPPTLEFAFQSVYKKIMDPLNWSKYNNNLSSNLIFALREAKSLPEQNIGIYLQDKSARICFANLEETNRKVEQVLSDSSKYVRLGDVDPAQEYQKEVSAWYRKYKPTLKSAKEDVSNFLLPANVATPHLRVLLKNHKPGCPVRLTFSSVGTVTRNLSTFLDTLYLKPCLQSFSPRRLADTKQTALFVESINKHIWDNDIQEKPTIYALDVANFFPTVTTELALPAVEKALKSINIKRRECTAVLEGLKVLRKGSFFRWKEDYWSQISGCALGDVDSCSYTDLAMAHLLSSMIPAAETELSTNMNWFKIYRDDGLGITFDEAEKVLSILRFFNSFNAHIKWTIPECSVCLIPEVICPHYEQLDFLDTRITWRQVKKGNIFVWQFTMSAYSKPTDAHAYLSPSSCTAPHLNEDGISVAKTVGTRLRSIHSNDEDLLNSLNLYSGFLIARGYREQTIKFHLAAMANRDRMATLNGQFKQKRKLTIPLVTDLHPSLICLSKMTREYFSEACRSDPLLNVLVPTSSLIVTYRKLPNLKTLLCYPDQNRFASGPNQARQSGYIDTGCRCDVCKISAFGKFARSPSLPGFKIPIKGTTSCKSGPAVVYHLVCRSGRPECERAHYVGMASTSNSNVKPMSARWANHKYQHKKGIDKCQMTKHLITCHKDESTQDLIILTILEACASEEEAVKREIEWTHNLFAYRPTGLNLREEVAR